MRYIPTAGVADYVFKIYHIIYAIETFSGIEPGYGELDAL
jgi:hypothetical protein